MNGAFLRDHPYLISNLLGLAIVALCWLVAGPQRRLMLLSGAALVPFFPLAGLFSDGSYWRPSHLAIGALSPIHAFGGPVGIEDMMFLFIAGARCWFFATVAGLRRWVATAAPSTFLRAAATMTAAAFASLAVSRLLGLDFTSASYVLPAAFGVILLRLNPQYWPLALSGAAGSVLLAAIELRIWFSIWPEYRLAWTPGIATSRTVFGVPAGDVLWWAVVGAVHPLAMARCAGCIHRPRTPCRPTGVRSP
ncbi:MAG: hypothetical protein JNL66_17855 [Alphaproteobacteria bacterium]|nr:hypothetical protein [Alphaproteobacteria bacterium]